MAAAGFHQSGQRLFFLMATLYLTEQGTTLRKEGRRFVIERSGTMLSQIHEFRVERAVVFGHVQITTQALGYLLAQVTSVRLALRRDIT